MSLIYSNVSRNNIRDSTMRQDYFNYVTEICKEASTILPAKSKIKKES